MVRTRKASHAGSWYSDKPAILEDFLADQINSVKVEDFFPNTKFIISPHAGYMHSGRIAADGFKALQSSISKKIDKLSSIRIYLLGPMHHTHIGDRLGLTRCGKYETPLGDLTVDVDECELISTLLPYRWLSPEDEEDEHSLEMQLPMLYHTLDEIGAVDRTKIIPILVSGLSKSSFLHDVAVKLVVNRIFNDPSSFLIVSTDFCHYGERFGYCPSRSKIKSMLSMTVVGESDDEIETLDRVAIDILCHHDFSAWMSYLEKTGNTICGRQPLKLIKAALDRLANEDWEMNLLSYRRNKFNASSVSYASLSGQIKQK